MHKIPGPESECRTYIPHSCSTYIKHNCPRDKALRAWMRMQDIHPTLVHDIHHVPYSQGRNANAEHTSHTSARHASCAISLGPECESRTYIPNTYSTYIKHNFPRGQGLTGLTANAGHTSHTRARQTSCTISPGPECECRTYIPHSCSTYIKHNAPWTRSR